MKYSTIEIIEHTLRSLGFDIEDPTFVKTFSIETAHWKLDIKIDHDSYDVKRYWKKELSKNEDKITVVSSDDFRTNPDQYLANVSEQPVAIVAPSGARLTISQGPTTDVPEQIGTPFSQRSLLKKTICDNCPHLISDHGDFHNDSVRDCMLCDCSGYN